MTAGVRAGACIHAQRPRPGGPVATPAPGVVAGALPLAAAATLGTCKRRRAHRNARSLRRGGPVRWPTKRHCGKRAAGTVPVRMPRRADPCVKLAKRWGSRGGGKACHTCARDYHPRNAVWQAGSGAGMACEARAANVSAQHCSWQPSGMPNWGYEKRRRACHSDTATSLRSEDGVWQAFRRDASA